MVAAVAAYAMWGVVPLYWKQLAAVDAVELIAHRLVWSLVLLVPLIAWRRQWDELATVLRTGRGFAASTVSGLLLSANWLIYVWAVNAGHVVECSLGYFLVPLLNVALGRVVLGERLRRLQVIAVAVAAAGVGLLVVRLGHVPWIALGLAGSFGFYGLMRKRSPLGPLRGLTAETLLLAPVAGAFLGWRAWHGGGALGHVDGATTALVISTGLVTAVPLLLWASAARRLPLATLGILQYVAPTLQFLLGVALYHEPLPPERLQAFALIWIALVLYTGESLWQARRQRPATG